MITTSSDKLSIMDVRNVVTTFVVWVDQLQMRRVVLAVQRRLGHVQMDPSSLVGQKELALVCPRHHLAQQGNLSRPRTAGRLYSHQQRLPRPGEIRQRNVERGSVRRNRYLPDSDRWEVAFERKRQLNASVRRAMYIDKDAGLV